MNLKGPLLIITSLFVIVSNVSAQTLSQIADDTFKYQKAGTFAKPKVVKELKKINLSQVRVHYKTVSSRNAGVRSGREYSTNFSAFLDSKGLTVGDLEALTNEFQQSLAAKLAAAGIEVVPFEAVKNTEYYTEKLNNKEKEDQFDGKNGQAWVSTTANNGPTFFKWNPAGTGEIVGFGQQKGLAKTRDAVGAALMMVDVVVDFATIDLSTDIQQTRIKGSWFYNEPQVHRGYELTGNMNAPRSYIFIVGGDNKFGDMEAYASETPITDPQGYPGKAVTDPSRSSELNDKKVADEFVKFGVTTIVTREDYIFAARRLLNLYADFLVEKFKVLRGIQTTTPPVAVNKPADNTRLETVNAEAIKNNSTTAVTRGEREDSAKAAVKEGKYKLAEDYYGSLLKDHPNEMPYWFERGNIRLMNLDDFKGAIADYDQAAKLDSSEPAILMNRGIAYVKLSEFKKARKDLEASEKLFGSNAPAQLYYYLAAVIAGANDANGAFAAINRAIQIDPRFAPAYRFRAALYKATGKPAQAQADEIKAAQLEAGQ